MNIKSLLIGSAAALAVVSGAQAADAVVAAEPEPMEYVKVCDAYGTGFFYIPGTETCLKIGGQFRYEKNFYKFGAANSAYWHHSRIRLIAEAKNDSEWGTVYSWLRIQGDQGKWLGTDGNSVLSYDYGKYVKFQYYMGIGGLEFGSHDNPWTRFNGYGGLTDWGGSYGYQEAQYVSYTADFGAAKAWISLDHDSVDGSKYMPDVSAGVNGTFGDYSALLSGGYDDSDDSFAIKAAVRGNIDMFGFALMGLYSESATNRYFAYDGFSIIAGLSAKVTDSITLAKDFQYWDNGDWRIIGDVNWAVAPGFSVLVEASYGDFSGIKEKSGMLRFQRSF